MTLTPARFFVDESILGVAKALAIVRRDVVHPGHPRLPEVPVGSLDPTWMPKVAALDLVVIARDKRIRTKPVERSLLRAHGLRVFWIGGKKDLGSWGNLKLLVAQWDNIERIVGTRGEGPWFQVLTAGAVRELPV
jgi:hypothetical protein